MSKKLEKFNAIMDEAGTNFQKLNEKEQKKLLLNFPMFGKKLLNDLFGRGVFETLANEYRSFGVIEDTLYIALRKGENKPVQEREIISIAKYKGDNLNYLSGSNTKITVPLMELKDNSIVGPISFLQDPLSAYMNYLAHKTSVILLQSNDDNKLDKYSKEIFSHIATDKYQVL